MILAKDSLREQAVPETMFWAETWRNKRRQSGQSSPNEVT